MISEVINSKVIFASTERVVFKRIKKDNWVEIEVLFKREGEWISKLVSLTTAELSVLIEEGK